MKKYAHLTLLLSGVGVSFLAAIRLLSDRPADSLRQIRHGFGGLAFMFAPFVVLALLGVISVAWGWSRAAQHGWLVTNCLVTVASVVFYLPMIWHGPSGCMDALALGVVALFAWPVMLGVWLLAWLVLRAIYAHRT
jgi:hypothetical protein